MTFFGPKFGRDYKPSSASTSLPNGSVSYPSRNCLSNANARTGFSFTTMEYYIGHAANAVEAE